MKKCIGVVAAILVLVGQNGLAQVPEPEKIREGITKLNRLVGEWNATWKFHGPNGVTEQTGIHSVALVLNDTYLQWKIERHRPDNRQRSQSMLIYTTFNPKSEKYDEIYLYSGSALRVTETGEYDETTHKFTTKAFIPLEDGVRDENVRTVTDMSDPNRLVYTHFSRYNDESTERMDLEIILERIR